MTKENTLEIKKLVRESKEDLAIIELQINMMSKIEFLKKIGHAKKNLNNILNILDNKHEEQKD